MGLLQQGQAQAGAPAPAAPSAAQLAQSAAAAGAPPPGAAAGAPPPMPAQAQAGAPPAGAPAPTGEPAGIAPGGGLQQGGKATGEGVELQMEEATPEQQKEYERAMGVVSKALYGNEKLSNSIVDQVDPNEKVDSTSKVSMLLIQQLDKKANFDEIVVADVTEEVVTRIVELAEARHGIDYGEDEMQVILSSTWEGIAEMFGGMDEGGVQELVGKVGHQNMQGLKQNHEAALRG